MDFLSRLNFMRLTVTKTLLSAFLVLLCFSGTAIASSIQQQFNQQYHELKTYIVALDKAKWRLDTAEVELESERKELIRSEREKNTAHNKLKKLRRAEEQFTDIDFGSQINDQRNKRKEAIQSHANHKQIYESHRSKVRTLRITYEKLLTQVSNKQNTVRRLVDQLIEADINRQLSSLRNSRRIKVSTSETCSLSITKDACRDKARAKAERLASEKGSVVVVSSVTEMKNFKLSKDQAKSRVKARISDIKVLKDSYDLTADKNGWRVSYAISALVTPIITRGMKDELRFQSMRNLNIDKSLLKPVIAVKAVKKRIVQKRQNKYIAEPVVHQADDSFDDDLIQGWSKSYQRYNANAMRNKAKAEKSKAGNSSFEED